MYYKVCIATNKKSGKVVAGLTHIVEIATEEEAPKNYSLENERWYFDYYFFTDLEKAKKFVEEKQAEK